MAIDNTPASLKRLADIPVIFVSDLLETEEKVQGFALGAFVTKPYQREELLARVHTHTDPIDLLGVSKRRYRRSKGIVVSFMMLRPLMLPPCF